MSKKKTTSKKKKIIRNVVCTIFSFLLAVSLFVLLGSIALNFGFFNKEMTLNKINESDYYTNVYKELMDNIGTILKSKEMPEGLLDEVITEKKVYINGKQYINNSLDDKDTILQTEDLTKELTEIFENYYKEKKVKLDNTVKTDITSTVNAVVSEYTRMTRFQFVSYIRQYKQAIGSVLRWLLPVMAIIAIILMVLMLLVVKYRHRGVRFIAISFFAAGGMNLILPVYGLATKWYNHLDISPSYYAGFLGEYFKLSTLSFCYVGCISFVIGLLLLLIVGLLKNQLK